MNTESSQTYWVRIYTAGPLQTIEQICREYVTEVGACVTVTPTKYIYTGGEETGVIIELINYPRFPSKEIDIWVSAETLAEKIMLGACQGSYTLMDPNKSFYVSRRDEFR